MVLSIVKAQDYIDQVRWQYAKTMPDWPHEYTIKSWRPDLAREFESLCQLILNEGVVAPWPPPPGPAIYHNNYLVVGDWKYWAMGPRGDSDAVTDETVINREYCGPNCQTFARTFRTDDLRTAKEVQRHRVEVHNQHPPGPTASGKVTPDHDGDYPVRFRDALCYVRLIGDVDAVVQVFATAVSEIESSPGLLEKLNEINS